MLLDLGRNDISRVSQVGTVKVTDKMYVEFFSHVMHIVSNIVGKLIKGKNSTDVLFSGFQWDRYRSSKDKSNRNN